MSPVVNALASVKEDNQLKESSTTNSPQGTVSQKTQQSVQLLLKALELFLRRNQMINPKFVEHIFWTTLQTTELENLHDVSHFIDKTFSVLQYAMDFNLRLSQKIRSNASQSVKARYYTHPASYYPVLLTGMPFNAAKFITPLPTEAILSRTCHEGMDRKLQTSEAENSPKWNNKRQNERANSGFLQKVETCGVLSEGTFHLRKKVKWCYSGEITR